MSIISSIEMLILSLAIAIFIVVISMLIYSYMYTDDDGQNNCCGGMTCGCKKQGCGGNCPKPCGCPYKKKCGCQKPCFGCN